MAERGRTLLRSMTAQEAAERFLDERRRATERTMQPSSMALVAVRMTGSGPELGLLEVSDVALEDPLRPRIVDFLCRDWSNSQRQISLGYDESVHVTGVVG